MNQPPDGFNFPNSERQGSIDLAELAAYVRGQARVADANSKEWLREGANRQSAYQSGMWFAYRDILNRLSPEAYKVTVPGGTPLPTQVPVGELRVTIELLQEFVRLFDAMRLFDTSSRTSRELARLETLIGKEWK